MNPKYLLVLLLCATGCNYVNFSTSRDLYATEKAFVETHDCHETFRSKPQGTKFDWQTNTVINDTSVGVYYKCSGVDQPVFIVYGGTK